MYVSTFNPNQAVAFSQGYQTGATTAIPLQIKPSWSGNTVIYGFNPLASQALSQTVGSAGLNPAIGQAVIGQPVVTQGVVASPVMAQGVVNPLTSGINSWNVPVTTANTILAQQALAQQALTQQALAQQAFTQQAFTQQALAQQAFANPFISSGVANLNAIAATSGLAQMRVDLAETNSDVVVAAELPNVSLNDLSLTVTDDSLSISATAFAGNRATSLYRTIALPTTIKSEQVEATYANGILEIRAPKSDLVSRRKVKVTVAQ